jgi:hypothetical protein
VSPRRVDYPNDEPPDYDARAGWPPPRDDDEELLERAAEESYERELTWRQLESERFLDGEDELGESGA